MTSTSTTTAHAPLSAASPGLSVVDDAVETPTDLTARQRLEGTPLGTVSVAARFYSLLLRLGARAARTGVSADRLTIVSLSIAIGAGVALGFSALWTAFALVILSGIFDILDGTVARASGTTSRAGALLDSSIDRFSDAAPMAGLAVLVAATRHPALVLVPMATVVGSAAVSYVRARAETLGVELPALYARRPERIVALSATLLIGALAGEHHYALDIVLAGVGLIAVVSFTAAIHLVVIGRRLLVKADSELDQKKPPETPAVSE